MGIDIYNVTSAVGTTSTATAKTTKASDKTSESKSSDKASFQTRLLYMRSLQTQAQNLLQKLRAIQQLSHSLRLMPRLDRISF